MRRDVSKAWAAGRQLVGRESELALLRQFVLADAAPTALALTGGPGVGKTTLWEAGAEIARQQGLGVLSARPSDAETGLSFAAVADLLDGVDVGSLAGVPAPQLRALEVALLRAEPADVPPELLAISAGFLNVLRALSNREPLLVAVDDVQWLDRPSAGVLVFAARRLRGHPIRFLLARRPGDPTSLERALEPLGLEWVEVGALSLGAARRLLSERLGLTVSRRVLRLVFETGRGNPLFMLELGRTLAERGVPEVGKEIPVPDRVEDLLGLRVAGLPGPVRRLLLAIALSADLRVSQLAAIADPTAVEDAVDAGLLLFEGDRVRASHPLLAAAARACSRAQERRGLHLELAHAVADDELRARHLALATEGPDEELAAAVAAAAAGASVRGATAEAVELAEHALRLTPPGSAARSERLLTLAGYLETAGERQRVTDLLTPEVDSLPPGAARARAWLLLSEGGAVRSNDDHERYFERALAESRGDPGLHALVLAKKAINTAAQGVERIREAEAWALEALPEATRAGADVERLALHGLGWARCLRGQPIDDVCERFRAASDAAFHITDSPEPVAGLRLMWRGDVSQARVILARFLSLADERGEAVSYALQRLNMCELELRAGDWAAVSRLLDEWAESADGQLLITPTYQRCRALLAAGRGFPDEAQRWATPALAGAEAGGYRWQVLESLRALGIAALLQGEPGRAVESLRSVWEYTQREGIDEPGAFPVAPDLVEALTESRELEEARAVFDGLNELAEAQEHPWGLATAKRCGALILLASSTYDQAAASALAEAAADYGELGLRFDQARSLLTLGRAERRLKKWGAARRSLERAAAAFDEIGSEGWAAQARAELARVSARKPRSDGGLTPTEQRVATLAADGLSNKEIAAALFVTVHTVEAHLSHAYRKLGVRSRAQLTHRLSTET
jgi:DNA-binding CsgD family transcriptional regulator/tetratricopeptide (TPR) repeat protein